MAGKERSRFRGDVVTLPSHRAPSRINDRRLSSDRAEQTTEISSQLQPCLLVDTQTLEQGRRALRR